MKNDKLADQNIADGVTMVGMTLVNAYPAFKYFTDREMTLREFTSGDALASVLRWWRGGGGAWPR